MTRVVAVIPARGGSKGLPGKNLALLAGIPLIAHSIRFARLCLEIDRLIVSTDSEEIAAVARAEGAEVPFLRPPALAGDETAMWPVLRHALAAAEAEGGLYDFLLLLDPTSPGRLPADVAGALERLRSDERADGVVGVSEPPFNPIWHCVVENDGYMEPLIADGTRFVRRQDVPRVLRINASIYIWRTAFVRPERDTWMGGRHLLFEIPEARAVHIDDADDLSRCEALVAAGLLELPSLR